MRLWHNIRVACWIIKRFKLVKQLKSWRDVKYISKYTILPALQGKKLYYTTYKCVICDPNRVITGRIIND